MTERTPNRRKAGTHNINRKEVFGDNPEATMKLLVQDGLSDVEIARRVGWSKSFVGATRRAYGITSIKHRGIEERGKIVRRARSFGLQLEQLLSGDEYYVLELKHPAEGVGFKDVEVSQALQISQSGVLYNEKLGLDKVKEALGDKEEPSVRVQRAIKRKIKIIFQKDLSLTPEDLESLIHGLADEYHVAASYVKSLL